MFSKATGNRQCARGSKTVRKTGSGIGISISSMANARASSYPQNAVDAGQNGSTRAFWWASLQSLLPFRDVHLLRRIPYWKA